MKKIPLRGKYGQGKYAIVDDDDFARVSKFKWHVLVDSRLHKPSPSSVVSAEKKTRKTIYLGRFITNAPKGKVVDHINHNIFDNRKSNLRICTQSENTLNRRIPHDNKSGFKGVHFNGYKWIALIGVNDKLKYIGGFENRIDAAKAYNEAAIKYHGDFACINVLINSKPLQSKDIKEMEKQTPKAWNKKTGSAYVSCEKTNLGNLYLVSTIEGAQPWLVNADGVVFKNPQKEEVALQGKEERK